MNREFKSKFSQMQDNHSGLDQSDDNDRLYTTAGQIRNVCFVWPDGRLRSFNYAYLVTHEYDPEAGTIRMEFTTHNVLLKGFGLEPVYFELLEQRNRLITCIDARYNETVDHGGAIINEILITERG